MNLDDLDDLPLIWDSLSTSEQRQILAELDAIEDDLSEWRALPGPQTVALNTDADIILYGGAAGGGKSFLALGKALTQHRRVLILRREFPQLAGLIETSKELYARYGKFTGTPQPTWRLRFKGKDKLIEFGSCQHEHDKNKYQGRPHDLRVLDEAANFLESQVDFLAGWVRSEDRHQKCQLLLLSNPPTSGEGRWLFEWFAAWLDDKHPNPALPGELRWFAKINGLNVELKNHQPFVLDADNKIIYDFNPADYSKDKIVTPKSRTFIPARVTDNPYYVESGYIATLQALPEPLRSQMLYGDFNAGQQDDAWQVIPTEWVLQAQKRWRETPKPDVALTAIGVDVARGGDDKTALTKRYDNWVDKQIVHAGQVTPDGDAVAALVFKEYRDDPLVIFDVIGVGASAYDAFKRQISDPYRKLKVIPFHASEKSEAKDQTRQLTFFNQRSERYWKMREMLDPKSGLNIALPDDRELRADLCSPRWELTPRGIKVESKDDIVERLGHSPDKGDSCIYAFVINTKRPPQSANINIFGR
jgi:hypothetical protein